MALTEAGIPQITDWVAISDEDYTTTSDVATGQQMLSKLFTAAIPTLRYSKYVFRQACMPRTGR